MVFGKWKKPKIDQDEIDKIILGYDIALDEINGLIGKIESDAISINEAQLNEKLRLLNEYCMRIIQVKRTISVDSRNFGALADDADAMERIVAALSETVWGYDEARVSGLLLAWGVLKSLADRFS